ncbi:DNA methyltransferase [Dokdonella sp.]|uniref:class I SAM-dependent DNA methyltransferase n=1 Tax=Dokdonella sp. TaxID=2291710 RepID=UPI0027B8B87B|nr:DNA methyltransferase [Dokdonella sp.]
MTPHEFIAKWKNGGDERRDAQPFFEDLCRLVGHKTPREADPEHKWFTYEYGATKTSGGDGWADVWKKGFFGWEAKGTHKDLDRAYEQLKMYADALENPPLLVVSDLHTIIVHTNFTNTVKREIKFTVEDLADFDKRQILDAVFNNPEALRPTATRAGITQDAAAKFTTLAESLRGRGCDPHAVAHFLNRLLFAMFAEDIRLLPNNLFTKLVKSSQGNPDLFEKRCRELFVAMNKGGDVAFENVPWFNGGLFDDDAVLPLTNDDLKTLHDACVLDWSSIEPSIFGTLFERGLDPSKRSQLGAHYTDPDTIMKIVRPVVVAPWLRAWEAEKVELVKALDKAKKSVSEAALKRYARFLESLRAFTVLDPACGSGNFLYLALRSLKDIEKRVIIEGEALGLPRQFPGVGPRNVRGIELNDYAAELARLTIWIGEIQWMIQNGFGTKRDPILQPLDQVENRDAVLNPDGTEASWPTTDAIIGNPPFLGAKKHWGELGRKYTDTLRAVYKKRVPGMADLVCYWFEKANDALRAGHAHRIGLVATNSIRAGASREVLIHATEYTRIFDAWDDEDWVNEGAAVRVSLVCFGHSAQEARLDGTPVAEIFPDLTANDGHGGGVDLTQAEKLPENEGCAFVATVKSGPFEISGSTAREWLKLPNPNGRSNADVVRPWANGLDVSRRPSDTWIVDFGVNMTQADAAMYEAPFAHVVEHVKEARSKNNRKAYKEKWWRLAEPIPKMRAALAPLSRYIATPTDGKQRIFAWLSVAVLPDHQLVVIARDDDTMFGLLHSRIHEVWSCRAEISRMGVGNTPRYKPPVHFEKFPFPEGLTPNISATNCAADPRAQRIADAARALVEARDRWLNPPEWTDRVPEVVAGYPDRIIAKPEHAAELKKRTLTNLYNARPAWLDNLHRSLDEAVAAAYGWPWPLSDDDILRRLFELNQARAR